MAELRQYDPALNNLIALGVRIRGYAPGSVIKAVRNEPTWKYEAGTDGFGTRTKVTNRSGIITITLAQASPANEELSLIASVDEATGLGRGSVHLTNLNDTTLVKAAQAWIEKRPDLERGEDPSPVEWSIFCHDLDTFIGGAVV